MAVKVQVVFRRKQKYYSTGKELSKEDWDRLLKAKSQLLMEVRADIESSFSIFETMRSCSGSGGKGINTSTILDTAKPG